MTGTKTDMTAKFNTAAEAKAIGAALFSAGKVTAWTDYGEFGSYILRLQIGKRWMTLTEQLFA